MGGSPYFWSQKVRNVSTSYHESSQNTYFILNELLIIKSLGLQKLQNPWTIHIKSCLQRWMYENYWCFLCCRCIRYFITLFLVNYEHALSYALLLKQKEIVCVKLDEATKLNWNGNAGTFARQRIMKVREDDFCYNKQCHTFQNVLQIPCLYTRFSCRFQIWKKLKFPCAV